MSSVDQLIEELFSDRQDETNADTRRVTTTRHDWDSEGEAESVEGTRLAPRVPSAPHAPQSRRSHFDEDSEEEHGSGTSPDDAHAGPLQSTKAQRLLYTVPFPDVAARQLFVCSNRCYVTNLGAVVRGGSRASRSHQLPHTSHPTLDTLRMVYQGKYDTSVTPEQMMRLKGAFHVLDGHLGNGCVDHHGDLGQPGGCPVVGCLRCGYGVVRLQDAAWNDRHGEVNLYLTLRNFYPDWSRLASSYAVGVADAKALGYVLADEVGAAAYCCQCSWLTVRCARAVIETHVTDAASYHGKEADTTLFATELPQLRSGAPRRPPLWVCRGHHRSD